MRHAAVVVTLPDQPSSTTTASTTASTTAATTQGGAVHKLVPLDDEVRIHNQIFFYSTVRIRTHWGLENQTNAFGIQMV